MKRRVLINVEVSDKMRKDYKRACKKLGTYMKVPVLDAISNTIERSKSCKK